MASSCSQAVLTPTSSTRKPKHSPVRMNLRQRLLLDIAELQKYPYPNITLQIRDSNLTEACLVLNVDGYGKIHMTIKFPHDYPLKAPKIKIDSAIKHPNIFGDYICASILNTAEGWTPAYTLKAIAIQLLSFFSSEKLEQVGGEYSVDLRNYRDMHRVTEVYECNNCERKKDEDVEMEDNFDGLPEEADPEVLWPKKVGHRSSIRKVASSSMKVLRSVPVMIQLKRVLSKSKSSLPKQFEGIQDAELPDEILLLICNQLETEDLMLFAQAWSRIALVMINFDVLRTRSLVCFCLKKDFHDVNLGIGVSFGSGRSKKPIESEFDLLSEDSYKTHRIRKSVQGVPFEEWLPLPISQAHWRRVSKSDGVRDSLERISQRANLGDVPPVQVIYHFMNDVVVKLNQQAEKISKRKEYWRGGHQPASGLVHASEKAIESYFHLFHLLLCLATEDPSIVRDANESLQKFIDGGTSKAEVPNLGNLLVSVLISDIEISQSILESIIKESITRNVVWMLDQKGANKPELAYYEPDKVSHYRLRETFEASCTSYRLLMFLNLFRSTAIGKTRKTIAILRDEAFERHGAPPAGWTTYLADSIKDIHQIDNWTDFYTRMGVPVPAEDLMSGFLKQCCRDSVEKGYSCMPLKEIESLALRARAEPGIETFGLRPVVPNMLGRSFFPNFSKKKGEAWRGRGGRGGGY